MAKYKVDLTGRKFNGIEVLGYSHCVKNKNSHGYTYYWKSRLYAGYSIEDILTKRIKHGEKVIK